MSEAAGTLAGGSGLSEEENGNRSKLVIQDIRAHSDPQRLQ